MRLNIANQITHEIVSSDLVIESITVNQEYTNYPIWNRDSYTPYTVTGPRRREIVIEIFGDLEEVANLYRQCVYSNAKFKLNIFSEIQYSHMHSFNNLILYSFTWESNHPNNGSMKARTTWITTSDTVAEAVSVPYSLLGKKEPVKKKINWLKDGF